MSECWCSWTAPCFLCSDRVQGLCYASHTRQLISCSCDGSIVIWNMDVTRQEVRQKHLRSGRLCARACVNDRLEVVLYLFIAQASIKLCLLKTEGNKITFQSCADLRFKTFLVLLSLGSENWNGWNFLKMPFFRRQNGWTATPARSVSSLSSGISSRCGTARRSVWDRYVSVFCKKKKKKNYEGPDMTWLITVEHLCGCECATVFLSTTAGSVGRQCVANVRPNVPPSPWWASSSRCACVTAATSPSLTKSG